MNVTAELIKVNIQVIAPILRSIFNMVMSTAFVPDIWKKSFIIPIPKKGNNADIKNYRGVCLQSIIPKLFDKLLTIKLQNATHHLIPQQQHGFIKNRSTTTNITEFLNIVTSHCNAKKKFMQFMLTSLKLFT